ncbi:MAG: thioredoxin family protein [Phycisphaerae bacterium]|jgi:small redox-active disulfide protein 2|nr:thioredoxin family protein [Phycisphaerae bacterium]
MKKIRVLGTGCAKCDQLAANAEAAAKELGLEYELTKVTDINEITAMGVMLTPALVVDDQVRAMGNVPGVAEIVVMLS